MMKKKVAVRHGNNFYLIGKQKDSKYGKVREVWLEDNRWNCDWYWGCGCMCTFTNKDVAKAKDLVEFFHWDAKFMGQGKCSWNVMEEYFEDTVFTEKEMWTFCECMNTLMTLRKTADLLYRGGSHVTTNPIREIIIGDGDRAKDFNEVLIPAQWKALEELLTPEK